MAAKKTAKKGPSEKQLAHLQRLNEARRQQAEQRESADVAEPGILNEEDMRSIAVAMDAVEEKASRPVRPQADGADRRGPQKLADEVTQYFAERETVEYGAAVDARVREVEDDTRRTQREERLREPVRGKARPGETAAAAAQRWVEEERKRQMREAALPPVARDPETGARLPVEHRLRTPMRAVRRYAPDTSRIDPKLVGRDAASGLPNVSHWVSVEDTLGQGERSWSRVETMVAHGAEVIRKSDGTPLTSRFGVAMRQSPADYDAMVRAMAPTGADSLDDLVEPVMDIERQINRKTRSGGATSVFQMREHGVYRSAEALDADDVRDWKE